MEEQWNSVQTKESEKKNDKKTTTAAVACLHIVQGSSKTCSGKRSTTGIANETDLQNPQKILTEGVLQLTTEIFLFITVEMVRRYQYHP